MKIIFYLKRQQAEVRRFIGICLYECFIYCSNFVFRKCLETRRQLGSGRKTVSSQGYSELPEPIKTRENCYSTTTVYSLTKDKGFTVLYAPQRATYQANLDGKNNFPV